MNSIVTAVLTAVATSILTTIVLIVKERFQLRGQHQRLLAEKKLLELYNKLYVINLKYYSLLNFDQEEILTDVDENGNEQYRYEDIINDYTYWERAINESTEIIRQNIHLLDYEDVTIWHEFEMNDQKEALTQEAALEKYVIYKRFLKQTKKSYGKLFNEYHYQTRLRKRQRKKMYKKKLREIKQNPFYSKSEKQQRIKFLKNKNRK